MTDKPKDLSYGKKPPLSLVPPSFIIHVSRAMEDGAKKRSTYNWRQDKVSCMQLLDKVLRHVYKFLDGQNNDEESGLFDLAHAAADLAVLIDARENNCLVDDRPIPGSASKLISSNATLSIITGEPKVCIGNIGVGQQPCKSCLGDYYYNYGHKD